MSQIKPGTTVVGILPAGHKLVMSPLMPDVPASEGVEASTGSRGAIERYRAAPQSDDDNSPPTWELVKQAQLVADPAPSYTYGEFPYDVKIRIVCEAGGYSYSVGNNTGEAADPVVFAEE